MNNSPEEILKVLIAEGERLLPITFPPAVFRNVEWHADSWDYAHNNVARTRSTGVRFREHPADGQNRFHPLFEYALKAYLVHAAPGSSKASSVVSGARALWSTLLQNGMDPSTFRWDQVTQGILDGVERRMLDHLHLKESSTVIYSTALENFLRWLQTESVLPATLTFDRTLKLQTPRSLSPEDQAVRNARLVGRETLDELARFYQTAKEDRQRLLICAVGILMVAGFRISELLTIPADGLQKDTINGREKWYIRYWQRKPGKNKRLEQNKRWLSPSGSELVRVLWKEILSITADARKAARNLERRQDGGTRLRISWLDDDVDYLRSQDIDRMFGWVGSGHRAQKLTEYGIQPVDPQSVGLRGRHNAYSRDEVEAVLLQLQGPLVTHRSGNKVQQLSETLLICFEQSLDPRKRTSEILVRRMASQTLANFLDGQDRSSPLSGHLKTRTHAFRHWLNTVANKAGMSVFLISVWMQRANLEHTLAYLHDPLDIAELAREGLRDGRFIGRGADRIYTLEKKQREEQINSIHMAHVAATVICGLDMTHAECPQKKFCEECEHGFYDPADPQMRKALKARLEALESNLTRLQGLRERGIPIHERQFEQAEQGIATIRQRLDAPLPILALATAASE